jgi:hypothetical protein
MKTWKGTVYNIKEYLRMFKNKHYNVIVVYTWIVLAVWYNDNSVNFPSHEIWSLALHVLLFCDKMKLQLILDKI